MLNRTKLKYLILAILYSCILLPISIYSYQWPLTPFNQQGYVFGTLDECRSQGSTARHHFHDGIGIGNAPHGTSVYAVDDGTAYIG